jgi:uridine kinase
MDVNERNYFEEYARVVSALMPVLDGLPPRLIAIGGLPHSGKTTLGRFLSCRFNISLIESDLFRVLDSTNLSHKIDQISAIIEYRFNNSRPVIIEGAAVLRLLSQINRRPDFYIYVDNTRIQEALSFKSDIATYYREFSPRARADFTLTLSHEG